MHIIVTPPLAALILANHFYAPSLRAMIDDGRVRAKNIARAGAKKPTWRVVAESLREFRLEPPGAKVMKERLREAELERRLGI